MNALSPSPAQFRPYGLVSLWDMLRIKGPEFVRAITALSGIWMVLRRMDESDLQNSVLKKGSALTELKNYLETIVEAFDGLEVIAAKEAALIILNDIKNGKKITDGFLLEYLEQIIPIFPRELSGKMLYCMSQHEMTVFEKDADLFGVHVPLKLPSIIPEISECAKSYAFERHTASAFHALRCLEAGIRALSRCLCIPDPTKGAERNWAFALKEIKKGIDAHWPTSADRMSGDGHTFEDLYAALASMQNPWRNATMHLETRYNREEAESLIHVVKRFLSRLADRMDEDGMPKA